MSSVSSVQPSFFEGQYLGADDLSAIVAYFRTGQARHVLAARSWGIAAGLELILTEIAPGEFQAAISPGVAVDGYGRLVVVTSPAEVPTEKLLGLNSGPVRVWLRHAQTPIRSARPGFDTCGAEDAFERIEENFEIEVGNQSLSTRQSGVGVSGTPVVDARTAGRVHIPDGPLRCDGTVAYQDFPIDDEDSVWLIPVGIVSWQSAQNSFGEPSEDQRVQGRLFRRTFGTVTEDILAADGVIRLRDRTSPFEDDVDAACATRAAQASDFHLCDDALKARELVWVEGDMRVTGDVRLFGTRLEFRDTRGFDYIDRNVAGIDLETIDSLTLDRAANTKNGDDLRVLIGPAENGHNRFTIGPATTIGDDLCALTIDGPPRVVVQDNGLMGIGTAEAPDSDLSAPLTVRGLEGTTDVTDPVTSAVTQEPVWHVLNVEDATGAVAWSFDLWLDGESLSFNHPGVDPGTLFLSQDGVVGVRNTAPEAVLDVAGTPTGPSGGLGNNLWFRLGDGPEGADAGRVWVEYGQQRAPLLVMSDQDDPPRMQFQQTGAGADEFNPARSTWIGHLAGGSANFGIVGNGRIGLRTQTPFTDVTISGSLGFEPGNDPLIYMHESGFSNDPRMVLSHSPGRPERGLRYSDVGDRFVFQDDAATPVLTARTGQQRVGVLTETPNAALDVRGDIRLGDTGQLFALGAAPNMRVVAGEINANGTTSRGAEFISQRLSEGNYLITFTPGFVSTPFIVATGIANSDNLVSVESLGQSSCTIRCFDTVTGNGENSGPRDTRFMFIAMGGR